MVSDVAKIDLRLGMKDPGTPQNPSTPTSANFITVTRYHVKYVRSDGRNTQGVDVPFEFDGGASVTVRDASAISTLVITLVRAQAKLEAPLLALRNQGGHVILSTIAEVTLVWHRSGGPRSIGPGPRSVWPSPITAASCERAI